MNTSPHPHKIVQGTFHQGNSRFGYSAGIQCFCNTLVSLCYTKFRTITTWKTHDLDYILNEGDFNFKRLGFTESPFVDQFPKIIKIEGQECNVNFDDVIDGGFCSNDITINFVTKDLLSSQSGALIVIKGYSIAIIFNNNEFFIFDSHSRDSVGKIVQNGKSVSMRFTSIKDVKQYVRNTYSND